MKALVVGSGLSGVAAATVLLEGGAEVSMVDVGHRPGPASDDLAQRVRAAGPRLTRELRRELMGSIDFMDGIRALGGRVDARRIQKRILGSVFAFDGVDEGIAVEGASPPRSLAEGGLSNVWGAACYPLRQDDYAWWPVNERAMAPWFRRASEMLGLQQVSDPLSERYPLYGTPTASVPDDPSSVVHRALELWLSQAGEFARDGFHVGRPRLAVRPRAGREGCQACGMCYYGCAWDSIYSAGQTLAHLLRDPAFSYTPGFMVEHFEQSGRAVTLVGSADGAESRVSGDVLLVGAGPLSSLRIVADSLGLHGLNVPLLDNDLLLIPLVATRQRVSSRREPAFALSEAVIAVDPGVLSDRPWHLQFYSFHAYFLGGLGRVLTDFPSMARLTAGVTNNAALCFAYRHGDESVRATAEVRPGTPRGSVVVRSQPHPCARTSNRRLTKALARRPMGLRPIAGLAKATPLGFSGHLGGTLKYGDGPLTTAEDGRLAQAERVYVIGGAFFPVLPAQNYSYIVVANAMRVADAAMRQWR